MALDYTLVMFVRGRELSVQEIRAFLIRDFALEECSDWIGLIGQGVTVTVGSTERSEMVELGFTYPGVHVGFRLEKAELHAVGKTNMLRMVDALLQPSDIEAQFHFDDCLEFEDLVKSAGVLTLNPCNFWEWNDGECRALITHPHMYRRLICTYSVSVVVSDAVVNLATLRALLIAKYMLAPETLQRTWVDLVGGGLEISMRVADHDNSGVSKSGTMGGTLSADFSVNLFQYESARTNMTSIIRFILDRYDGDAEVVSGYEKSLLTRTAGQITLADEPDFWTPERKAIILGKP